MRGILFIISSPSGGGKGTLIREVLRTVPNIGYSVSFTTRNKREGEVHGKDYFFVKQPEFETLIEQGEFLEYASVHGNFYGTSRTQVEWELGAGRDVILEIDVQGAESIRRLMPESVGVFILPPSFEVLQNRLIGRQTESEKDLELRLYNARVEVSHYKEFEYIVVNDDVARATRDLQSIVYSKRLRLERQEAAVQNIIKTFENYKKNISGD
jgi:guanylate kinase